MVGRSILIIVICQATETLTFDKNTGSKWESICSVCQEKFESRHRFLISFGKRTSGKKANVPASKSLLQRHFLPCVGFFQKCTCV